MGSAALSFTFNEEIIKAIDSVSLPTTELVENNITFRKHTASIIDEASNPLLPTSSFKFKQSFTQDLIKTTGALTSIKNLLSAYLALLSQRQDVWGPIFQYPRCHFSGFYEIIEQTGALKLNNQATNHTKRYHIQDKDRIFFIGSIQLDGGNSIPFLYYILLQPPAVKVIQGVPFLILMGADIVLNQISDDMIVDLHKIFNEIIKNHLSDEESFELKGIYKTFYRKYSLVGINDDQRAAMSAYLISNLICRMSMNLMPEIIIKKEKEGNIQFTLNDWTAFLKKLYIQKEPIVIPLKSKEQKQRGVDPGRIDHKILASIYTYISSKQPTNIKNQSTLFASKTQRDQTMYEGIRIQTKEQESSESQSESDCDLDGSLSSDLERMIQCGIKLRHLMEEDSCTEDWN